MRLWCHMQHAYQLGVYMGRSGVDNLSVLSQWGWHPLLRWSPVPQRTVLVDICPAQHSWWPLLRGSESHLWFPKLDHESPGSHLLGVCWDSQILWLCKAWAWGASTVILPVLFRLLPHFWALGAGLLLTICSPVVFHLCMFLLLRLDNLCSIFKFTNSFFPAQTCC